MKSGVGAAPRLRVTGRLDWTGRFPRGGDTFSLAFGDVTLLAAEGVGGRDGDRHTGPRASPTPFPSLMREGIGALPEGTEVRTRARSGW